MRTLFNKVTDVRSQLEKPADTPDMDEVTELGATVEVDDFHIDFIRFKVTFDDPILGRPGLEGIEYQLERKDVEGLIRASYRAFGNEQPDNVDSDVIVHFGEHDEPVFRLAATHIGRRGHMARAAWCDYIVNTFFFPTKSPN